MVSYVFIRGQAGVGKTSVARKLKELFPAGATVEVNSIQAMLHSSQSRDFTQYSDAFGAAGLMALHFSECGYGPIIIIGHVTDVLLEEWKRADSPGESRVYTLLASNEVLRQRKPLATDQSPSQIPSPESGDSFQPLQTYREVVIETSALDVAGVCSFIADDISEEYKPSTDDEDIYNYG